METVCGLNLFERCRLCGANGIYDLDILEISSPGDELSEKIFRCVGIQVERNDKLTTKICGLCFGKINEFMIFRQICAATNVQMRIALLNAMADESAVGVAAEPKARLGIHTETQNALIESFSLEDQVRAIGSLDSSGAEMNQPETTDPSTMQSLNICSDAVVFDGTGWSSVMNEAHQAMEVPPASLRHCGEQARLPSNCESDILGRDANVAQQTTQSVTHTVFPHITVSVSMGGDESQYANMDDVVRIIGNAAAKKQKATSKKKKNRSFQVKCEAPRRGKCKVSFENRDAMMYHVAAYHPKSIKTSFECHLCKKSLSTRQTTHRHIDAVHTGLMPFKCPNQSCSMSFPQKSNLTRHIHNIHSSVKLFKCSNQKCSRLFSAKSNLQRHMHTVHAHTAHHSHVQMPEEPQRMSPHSYNQ